MADESARISPTAHYTGYVWYRHGLSHPALRTRPGAFFFAFLQPWNIGYRLLTGGPTLESMLLSRHQAIDNQLTSAIRSGRVGQVVEIAAGMSPRGLRFTERYPELKYIEVDLEDMQKLKGEALSRAGKLNDRHRVAYVDALRDDGPNSLAAIGAEHLDPNVGTAVITEGLLNYFDRETVEALWARIVRFLHGFPSGVYLSDCHLRRETFSFGAAWAFSRALQTFARGRIHFHYREVEDCLSALSAAGFGECRVDPPVAYGVAPASPNTEHDIVRVIDART